MSTLRSAFATSGEYVLASQPSHCCDPVEGGTTIPFVLLMQYEPGMLGSRLA